MKIRTKTLALTATLIALAISAWEHIWYEIKAWPAWWKILLAVFVGIFMTIVLIWSFGLEWLLLEMIGVKYPI